MCLGLTILIGKTKNQISYPLECVGALPVAILYFLVVWFVLWMKEQEIDNE